jgi:hypothetical protein
VKWSGLRRGFIELYKRKQIIWNPKHPCILTKLKRQDAWVELGKKSLSAKKKKKKKV